MRAFIITFLIAVVVAGGAAYLLWLNADKLPEGSVLQQAGQSMHPDDTPPPARTPADYHVLEAQGGIPLAEAQRAGLAGESYAYLRSFRPIQISEGVEPLNGAKVRDKRFDLGYQFLTQPPEEQYLEFNIGGNWDELHFGLGFDDSHPSDPEDKWAINFEIQGDGEILLEPTRLKPTSKPLFARIELSGVNRLTFVSRRVGYRNPFTPLLLDPFLKKSAQEPSETP